MLQQNSVVFAAIVLGLECSFACAQVPSYTSVEIGSLSGNGARATGININGDIVGMSWVPGASWSPFWYHHSSRSMVALNGIGVGGINDYGKMAGEVADPTPQAIAWYSTGGYDILPSPGFASAGAVSNNGRVTGNIDNGHEEGQAVLWSWKPALHMIFIGVLWEDPSLPGYGTSLGLGINALGDVVGSSDAGTGTTPNTAQYFGTHPFLYKNGQMRDLGALYLAHDGTDNAMAFGVNTADAVVGVSSTKIAAAPVDPNCPQCKASHAFLWISGKMSDLGNIGNVPGWSSQADSINDQGEVVGWADSNVNGKPTQRAFVRSNGVMYNLTFNVYARDLNVRLTEAVGINCNGWIAANGYDIRTPTVARAYLLIPRAPLRPQCPRPH